MCSPSLRVKYLYTLFEIILYGELSILPHLFMKSFIYISVDTCTLYTLGYNSIPFYLWCCSNYVVCVHLELPSFLTMKCFRLSLYAVCPNLRNIHFSKKTWFFLLENGIRNQYLYPRICFIATGVLLFLGIFNWQTKEIYMFIYISYVYMHIYTYFYI